MAAFPEMECWSVEHIVYMAIAVVGLLVYMFGLPVFIFFVIRHIQNRKLHNDKTWVLAVGGLYGKYEAHAVYYEIVQVRPCILQYTNRGNG